MFKPELKTFVAALLVVFALDCRAAPADFVDIVEASIPAVVNIETTRFGERPDPEVQRGQMPDDVPELFRRFFEPFGDGMPRGRPDRRGGGSGFIVREDGLIITNHHVIEDADEIIVRLADRRELVAELVGSDAETDVAVLRIDAEDLPTLGYGDSSALRPGEWVIAIGSPFQFEQSVTAGIVSAKGRTQAGQQQYVPFIQSDVAINRGNSGGPLINTDGKVVGINSWILSSSGGNIGLSFSIPVETAVSTIDQLLEFGRVSRWGETQELTVSLDERDEDQQTSDRGETQDSEPTNALGLSVEEIGEEQLRRAEGIDGGLLVTAVDSDNAYRAGVRRGDVIRMINNQQVTTLEDFENIVDGIEPGRSVALLVWRDGITQFVAYTPEGEE